jgi:putative redox protein
MPLMQVELTAPDFGFTATDEANHVLQIDIPVDQGGNGKGFRPMQMLLSALGGCSGVDIVSILKKQKQLLQSLIIKIDGTRVVGKEPSVWQTITAAFEFSGDVEPSKAYRAVELSINKYCSVAETLRLAGAEIKWNVVVNGQSIGF